VKDIAYIIVGIETHKIYGTYELYSDAELTAITVTFYEDVEIKKVFKNG